ncbi:MAG: polysaccharide biosynthesis protein [Oscillibacter sp.]|jgi:stage V sporulation protein B|nr:polysaccharide biosynthesis protein [Oscillibacter sp.]
MAKNSEKNMLVQGSILAAAGIITKIIGFLYRIPMANLLGNAGNGIYSVAFGIYNIALTLSSSSMPLAVSKNVSARVARDDDKNAKRVFLDAALLALGMGTFAAIALLLGADGLEALYHRPGLALPLRILAPTTFVVALLGTFRGWFQAHGNMVPTAISQILEQIMNAFVSVLAAWQLMRIYADSANANAYGAAGGTLGTLAGAVTGLVFVLFLFFRSQRRSRTLGGDLEEHSTIFRQLILTILPVILSQTIYQIGYTLDDFVFGNIMALKGFSDGDVSALQGIFNTQYNLMVNLPVSVATAMAASAVPSIVSAKVAGSRKELHRKITAVLKLNMAIAIPSAVGLALLAHPILFPFTSLGALEPVAASLLQTGSSAAIFYALSTITTAILQGCDYMRTPVEHCVISLAIHVALTAGLLWFTSLGVYALVIGNVTFPLLVSLLNCRSLCQKLGYRWRIGRTFGVPLVSAAGMGLVTWGSYRLVTLLLPAVVGLAVSLLLSVAAYGYLILRLHCFADSQLRELPMGDKLLRLAKKLER